MKHPYGMNPNTSTIADSIREVRAAYTELPETTCDHRLFVAKLDVQICITLNI